MSSSGRNKGMSKKFKCWLRGSHDYKKTESRFLKTCQRCSKTLIDYDEAELIRFINRAIKNTLGERPMIIVYHGKDEVLITTDEWEELFITDYFTNGGRDILDYDRITQRQNDQNSVEVDGRAKTRPEVIRIDLKCTVDFE